MNWIKIEDRLPLEFEEVLLFDGEVFWVGFYQKCKTETIKDVIIWWSANPNLGHAPFLAHTPKFWIHILQPERLNPGDSQIHVPAEHFFYIERQKREKCPCKTCKRSIELENMR